MLFSGSGTEDTFDMPKAAVMLGVEVHWLGVEPSYLTLFAVIVVPQGTEIDAALEILQLGALMPVPPVRLMPVELDKAVMQSLTPPGNWA